MSGYRADGRLGANISQQVFGRATSSSDIPIGIIGVGPERPYPEYDLVVDSLWKQGFINSRAFSLDLRSVDSPDGMHS